MGIRMMNLFDGKYPALAEQTNNFLNANSDRIIEEVKPQIKFEVTRLFQSVMADAFSQLPIEEFLQQLPVSEQRNSRNFPVGGRPVPPAAGGKRRRLFRPRQSRGF